MAPTSAESLSILDSMLHEVLVQTGKALKANAADGSKPAARSSGSIRERSLESIDMYHFALDNIEGEILRARAALMRDLAKLRAARAPPPPPTPPPEPSQQQPQQPQQQLPKKDQIAPTAIMGTHMLDLPSAAAHTMNPPLFVPGHESTPVAPFPDMGLDMSSGVDLAAKETNALQRNLTISMPAVPVATSSIGAGAAKSPNSVAISRTPNIMPQTSGAHIAPNTSTTLTGDDSSAMQMSVVSHNGTSGATAVASEAPEFTNMQFSLDTSTMSVQNAPPAPMPAFDLTGFTSNGAPGDFATDANFEPPNDINLSMSTETVKQDQNEVKNLDNVFDLDGGAESMDLDLDLSGTVNDSTFDDLFLDSGDNSGMGQFDNAFFGLD
ncbi:hypothetical protein MN608_00593 [Microdochium nivale]|nr:hypothetical protein MN608_00593 [Microdochium nivale]